MKYDYLLFDLDGMLVDTLDGVLISARYALGFFGKYFDSLYDLKPFLGPPLRYSFMKYGLDEAQCAAAIEKYREKYRECYITSSRLNDGISDALPKLCEKGYILGVATSKYEESAKDMLSAFGIDKYFVHITGSNKSESIGTKVQVIEEALKRFGISDDRERALMIGDMKYDDEGAAMAGIDSLGVYTGTAKPYEHELANATHIAYSIPEMTEILLSMG